MSKKDFTAGLDSLLGSNKAEQPKKGRPKDPTKRTPTKTSQEGTKNNETRATFIVNEEQLEKVKDIAYWDRKNIKQVVAEALEGYIAKYEKKNGTVEKRG